MISHMYNQPRLITQTSDDPESGVAEPAIGISHDASGLIVLVQEGSEIIINRATVGELHKAMREQCRLYSKETD